MSKQYPSWRRDIVMSVGENMRRSRAAIVQNHRLGGDERTVVTISKRVHAQRAQQNRKGIHDCSRSMTAGRTCQRNRTASYTYRGIRYKDLLMLRGFISGRAFKLWRWRRPIWLRCVPCGCL